MEVVTSSDDEDGVEELDAGSEKYRFERGGESYNEKRKRKQFEAKDDLDLEHAAKKQKLDLHGGHTLTTAAEGSGSQSVVPKESSISTNPSSRSSAKAASTKCATTVEFSKSTSAGQVSDEPSLEEEEI